MSPQLGQDGKAKTGASSRKSDDTGDEDMGDGKSHVKRKSRNLSEKKRRDQFNLLINELCTMVCLGKRKLDKSNVLKTAISFIKNHNQMTVQTQTQGLQEDWKPSFLSNEEFTHLMLEALDGFIMVFSCTGRILYASENITSLLRHIPADLVGTSIYEMFWEGERQQLVESLKSLTNVDIGSPHASQGQVTFDCHLLRGGSTGRSDRDFEPVVFNGYYRRLSGRSESLSNGDDLSRPSSTKDDSSQSMPSSDKDDSLVFVASGRLQNPQLIVEMSLMDVSKSEFTSRHSLEWKFLFLDHRAPPIIGYLPFEVLGTSGYDYYHVDDLERVSACHESLMQKGEGTSCCYRFLTKGQQWIWLQTQYYITYHQWNSKPEFIVCTHRVVPYSEVIGQGARPAAATLSVLSSAKRTTTLSSTSSSVGQAYSQQRAFPLRESVNERETLTKARPVRVDAKTSVVFSPERGASGMASSQKRTSKSSKMAANTHISRSGHDCASTEDTKSTCSSESFKSTASLQSRLSEQSLASCQSRQSQVSLQSRQSAKSQQSIQSLASSLVGQRIAQPASHSQRLNEGPTLHSPSYVVITSSNASTVGLRSPSNHVPVLENSNISTRSSSRASNHATLEMPFENFAQPSSPRRPASHLHASQPASVVSFQPVLPIGIEVEVVETSPALSIPVVSVPGLITHELPPQVILTAAQRHLYEQLKLKHNQLQRQIRAQQEELKRVSEQLLIAQYGAWGPALLKMTTTPLPHDMSEASGAVVTGAATATTVFTTSPVTFTPATPILVQTSPPCVIARSGGTETVCMADPSSQVVLRTSQQDLVQLSQQDVQMLLAQHAMSDNLNLDYG